ncbi:hypothetical protein EZV62_011717 [Acer yangbiense]|uniref:Aquaporin n=1 Tax=Acer yangbiense TaxID=1000413 RepID=A0A5C7I5C7_9ROSI|nr:hypothetical protein EZV62_011717 [Acer yangbiense]
MRYEERGLIGEEKQKQVPTTLKKILGLEEVLNVNIWRTSLAELLGTAILLFALDAIVIYSIQAETKTPNLAHKGPWRSVLKGQSLWLEIICSFVFLFASIWMAFDERQVKALGRVTVCIDIGIVLGLLVFVSTTLTSQKGYAGAGLNPARCLGPVLIRGGHLWDWHWVFWVGPAIASVAFRLYTKIIQHQHFHTFET